MIEVFKTDVRCPALAVRVLDRIHRQFDQCQANFDLDDCDRVLRIRMPGVITACEVIDLLLKMDVCAEILPDEVPTKNALVTNSVSQN